MSDNKVTIEVDKGDAEAVYTFLRQSAMRVKGLVKGMPEDRQEVYFEQPKRWDRVAVALGIAAGEGEDLPSIFDKDVNWVDEES